MSIPNHSQLSRIRISNAHINLRMAKWEAGNSTKAARFEIRTKSCGISQNGVLLEVIKLYCTGKSHILYLYDRDCEQINYSFLRCKKILLSGIEYKRFRQSGFLISMTPVFRQNLITTKKLRLFYVAKFQNVQCAVLELILVKRWVQATSHH